MTLVSGSESPTTGYNLPFISVNAVSIERISADGNTTKVIVGHLPNFSPFLVKKAVLEVKSTPQPIVSPVPYVGPYGTPLPTS